MGAVGVSARESGGRVFTFGALRADGRWGGASSCTEAGKTSAPKTRGPELGPPREGSLAAEVTRSGTSERRLLGFDTANRGE